MINVLPLDERKKMQVIWITHAVDFFVSTIKKHTQNDIDQATVVALNNFFHGESGARSIYRGYDHARQNIIQRQTLQCRIIDFKSTTKRNHQHI